MLSAVVGIGGHHGLRAWGRGRSGRVRRVEGCDFRPSFGGLPAMWSSITSAENLLQQISIFKKSDSGLCTRETFVQGLEGICAITTCKIMGML